MVPSLKFNHGSSKESLVFLDVRVKTSERKVNINLVIKDTDRHQYLQYRLSHPNHIKRSIVNNLALKLNKICSEDDDSQKYIHETRSWFQKITYSDKILDEGLFKVRFSDNEKNIYKKSKSILFFVIYRPKLQTLNGIIKRNLNWLYAEIEVKNLFSPRLMVSFRGVRKLSSY